MPTTSQTSTTIPAPRPSGIDLALFVLGTALAMFLAYLSHTDGPTASPADGGPFEVSVWAVPGMLLVTLPMLWRTTAPFVALGGLTAGLLAHVAIFGELVHCGAVYPIIAVLAYAVARRLRGRDRVIGFALTMLAVFTTGATEVLGIETVEMGIPLALLGFGLGAFVASRQPLVAIREEMATA
ncbi:MAG: hypothetical protein J7513_08915 [Solirubrobacteraceae bacterium]|nr:hypothetical protein [Solirubrobacteraceae bacterium]